MDTIIEKIELLISERTTELDIARMYSRNPTAHKWKECFRVWSLRELVYWRFSDLMYQAALLQKDNYVLGAGILLRASIETLAMLIYSNIQMEKLLRSDHSFWDAANKTIKLLFGSKDGFTEHVAINIISVIEKCDEFRDYELLKTYDQLSESTHPNWDGMQKLYSRIDRDNYIQYFENRAPSHFKSNPPLFNLLLVIFAEEYAVTWPDNFEQFEEWLEKNNEKLEAEMNQ